MPSSRCYLSLPLTLAAAVFAWTGHLWAAAPGSYQGFMGESDRGPMYIFDWSVPSGPVAVQTPIATGTTRRSAGGLAVSPDSATLYVADFDSDRVMTMDTATLTFAASTFNAGGRTHGMAVGPTGRFLYVAVGGVLMGSPTPNALTVIDLSGVLPAQSIPLAATPRQVAVTRNNSYVVVTLASAQAAVITIGNPHSLRAYVALGAAANEVLITPDSRRAVLPMQSLGLVSNINLATLARTDWPTPGCSPASAAMSPAGVRLYLACTNNSTYAILHGTTGAPVASGALVPNAFWSSVRTVSVTPDGSQAWFPGEPYGNIQILSTSTFTKLVPDLGGPEHTGNKAIFGGPFYEAIDSLIALSSFAGARESAPAACAPGQVFRVTARWRNSSAKAWSSVLGEVLALTGGNTLIEQSWDLTADGVVNPGETFAGVFRIQLSSCAPFTFQVSLAAAAEAGPTGGGFRMDRHLASPLPLQLPEAGEPEWTIDPQ